MPRPDIAGALLFRTARPARIVPAARRTFPGFGCR
jgi:hypothetical protein